MLETIKQALINYLPAFATAFTYIICCFKCMALLKKVSDETSLGELRMMLKQVIRDNTDLKCENSMLRQTNKELEDKISQIFDYIQKDKEITTEEVKDENMTNVEA